MDEQLRTRLQDDLQGLFRGELLFDDLSRLLYSTDASIFQIDPLGVAVPRDEADLQALVRYAAENHVPLVPRGAGTGLAGESLGAGLVVDLSRHFRGITDITADTVRVQPGVVCRELNERLAPLGRRFAPDPASGEVCTLGGMLATNASGTRALRYGYMRDHVAGLRVVLDNGDTFAVSRQPRPRRGPVAPADRLQEIVGQVAALLERHDELIRACQPRARFNRCGYLPRDVLTPDALDLARLLVGSEGTLAFFTEATLRTTLLPGGHSLVVLGFSGLEEALHAARVALPFRPVSCNLLDRRLLTLVRGRQPELAALVPAAEAVLVVEYETDTPAEAADAVVVLLDRLCQAAPFPRFAVTADTPAQVDRLRGVRELALPNLLGMRGRAQPVAGVEDVAVPPDELPTFLPRVQEVLRRHDVTASFLIDAGTGQVHLRPFLDLQNPKHAATLWGLADEIHGLALELGGTVSSRHGTGLARTPWVARQYGRLYPVFEELKAIFDPHGLLNPGKIIGPDPALPAWPLRRQRPPDTRPPDEAASRNRVMPEAPVRTAMTADTEATGAPSERAATSHPTPTPADSATLPLTLSWPEHDCVAESLLCNGCGECRTEAPGRRMCPIFHATRDEAATPRAKANLMRQLLRDAADARPLSPDEVRDVADLCVNCKMCALECPARVNVPKLMLEAKAANVAEHGLRRSDWVMARTERFAGLGSMLSFAINAALESRTVRWLLEKLLGVSQQRRLPTFAAQSFLRRAARRGWTQPPGPKRPRVAYFVDVYANYNDPLIGEAVVAVLQHHGIEVYVPPGQTGCGIAPLAYGDVDAAREAARRNVRVFVDLVRQGYRVVCSEPSAALMLRHDYLDLLDDADARTVAGATVEFTTFLEELRAQGRLRTDFRRLDLALGHHVPCHVRALGRPPAAPGLLKLIPGLRVRTIDVHCSGMAGTFGLKAENYALSAAAGRPMLEELARPEVRYGSTECSTCRLQMEDLGGKRTLHPVQYLALAYGLMPDLLGRLQRPLRARVL